MSRAFSKILVLVILIVLAGGGFFAWQYLGAPREEVKDETADWQTYRDEEYGFEIKYPENYTIGKTPAKNNQFVTFSVDNLQIIIYPTDLSLDDFINDKAQSYLIRDYQRINFLGQDAYEGVNQGMTNAYEIATKNEGYIYELVFSTNNKDTFSELKAGLTTEQNQMLSTFRFLEVKEEGEEQEEIGSFEECLILRDKVGWVDSKTSSLCECDTPDGQIFTHKMENVENLVAKYTDEKFSFSFYYPKSFELSTSHKYFKGADIYLTTVGGRFGDDIIAITKFSGQRVEDSDAKFGKIAYYYDESKKQWTKDEDTDYRFGISPAKPKFYTISGLPVFSGVGRWATNIVALSTDNFLIINMTGSGWTRILDPLTKTVALADQKVEDEELKFLLKEEICSLKR